MRLFPVNLYIRHDFKLEVPLLEEPKAECKVESVVTLRPITR